MPGVRTTMVGSSRVLRGDVAEALEQVVRIIFDRAHAVGAEERREDALHDRAVFQHIADAAGRSAVVFQDEIIALVVADQIGAADVDVDVARHVHVEHLAAEHLGAVDQFRRDDPFLEDALVVIDVLAEEVERGDALDQARARCGPIRWRGTMRGTRSKGKIFSTPRGSL